MRAVIFASGDLTHADLDRARLRPDDWLIAADGGARYCRAIGLTPQTLIGDFDSLSPSDLDAYRQQGVEVLSHPSRKDETDLELALRLAAARGAQDVLVLGALGHRWDQTLANLLLPAARGLEALSIRLVDGPQEIVPLRPGQRLEISGRPGDTVSLIPLAGDAAGVSTEGLEYPLSGDTLPFGSTLGVSNTLVADRAHISLGQGWLVCLIFHHSMEPS
ncbi:MAG: thiamine diphosphokinase [Chloroflexota bacterium]